MNYLNYLTKNCFFQQNFILTKQINRKIVHLKYVIGNRGHLSHAHLRYFDNLNIGLVQYLDFKKLLDGECAIFRSLFECQSNIKWVPLSHDLSYNYQLKNTI